MPSKATSIAAYLDELPEERKTAMKKLYTLVKKNLPKGFADSMQYGMISFVVPHSIYPDGYHCKPSDALPFMSIASQKNFISVHHLGIYGDAALAKWFTDAYAKLEIGKPDMGKGCIRFKKPEKIPFELIAELSKKITVKDWIGTYEKWIKKK
ncbi:MAG: DUF1801 domain-containing protein [Ferruginibacter sp.]